MCVCAKMGGRALPVASRNALGIAQTMVRAPSSRQTRQGNASVSMVGSFQTARRHRSSNSSSLVVPTIALATAYVSATSASVPRASAVLTAAIKFALGIVLARNVTCHDAHGTAMARGFVYLGSVLAPKNTQVPTVPSLSPVTSLARMYASQIPQWSPVNIARDNVSLSWVTPLWAGTIHSRT